MLAKTPDRTEAPSRITQVPLPLLCGPAIVGNRIVLGHGTVLAALTATGAMWSCERPSDTGLAAMLGAAYGREVDPDGRQVRAILEAARAMLIGRRAEAADALSSGRFGELDRESAGRLAKAEAMLKAGAAPRTVVETLVPGALAKGYDPNEPRDERGRWTSEGGEEGRQGQSQRDRAVRSSDRPQLIPAAAVTPATEDEKEKFTDDHFADAQSLADKLHMPVENILGLSAFESGWGKGPYAADGGNNFLSLHYPAPFATGYRTTPDGKAKVATFES